MFLLRKNQTVRNLPLHYKFQGHIGLIKRTETIGICKISFTFGMFDGPHTLTTTYFKWCVYLIGPNCIVKNVETTTFNCQLLRRIIQIFESTEGDQQTWCRRP